MLQLLVWIIVDFSTRALLLKKEVYGTASGKSDTDKGSGGTQSKEH
jgi:hypothetical protein